MVLNSITYYQVFGLPLILWGGVLTLLCLLFTASISVMNKKGIDKIPMKWHFIMARITIVLALIHGLLGVLARF